MQLEDTLEHEKKARSDQEKARKKLEQDLKATQEQVEDAMRARREQEEVLRKSACSLLPAILPSQSIHSLYYSHTYTQAGRRYCEPAGQTRGRPRSERPVTEESERVAGARAGTVFGFVKCSSSLFTMICISVLAYN